MSEQEESYVLANKILSRINGDPDDDLAILSRQLLRHKERLEPMSYVWTDKRPESEGYWWYQDDDYPQQPVYIYDAVGGLFVELWNGQIFPLVSLSGQWSSAPIEEPKEA